MKHLHGLEMFTCSMVGEYNNINTIIIIMPLEILCNVVHFIVTKNFIMARSRLCNFFYRYELCCGESLYSTLVSICRSQ